MQTKLVSKFYNAPRYSKTIESTEEINRQAYFTRIRKAMAESKPRLIKVKKVN